MTTKSNIGIAALALGLAVTISCADQPTTPDAEAPVFGHKPNHGGGGGPGGGDDFIAVNVFLPDPEPSAAGIVSDGRGLYVHGVCGVTAQIDGRPNSDGSMRLNSDEFRIKRKEEAACGTRDPRFVELRFKSENFVSGPLSVAPETFRTFGIFVVRAVLDIIEGSPESRNVSINNGKCGVLSFSGEGNSIQATVTRQDETTWLVNADLGYCRNEGSLWHMPLSVTITKQ